MLYPVFWVKSLMELFLKSSVKLFPYLVPISNFPLSLLLANPLQIYNQLVIKYNVVCKSDAVDTKSKMLF